MTVKRTPGEQAIHERLLRQRRYKRKKRKLDPVFRLTDSFRHLAYNALRLARKANEYNSIIGCSPNMLKEYLEGLFQAGMTWENYGELWHVDHIMPCRAFDLSLKEERTICFHYSNLRPMWAQVNLSKGAKYNESE